MAFLWIIQMIERNYLSSFQIPTKFQRIRSDKNVVNPSGHETCGFDFDVLVVNLSISVFDMLVKVDIAKLMHRIVLKYFHKS